MKITPEHFETLSYKILTAYSYLGATALVRRYEAGNFPRSEKVKDLQKRFCFDVLSAADGGTAFVCDTLYPYLNDTHIYSALKSILPTLTRKY